MNQKQKQNWKNMYLTSDYRSESEGGTWKRGIDGRLHLYFIGRCNRNHPETPLEFKKNSYLYLTPRELCIVLLCKLHGKSPSEVYATYDWTFAETKPNTIQFAYELDSMSKIDYWLNGNKENHYIDLINEIITIKRNNKAKKGKYITSSFSNLMFTDHSCLLQREELDQHTFLKETSDAKSCISAFDIAEELALPFNKEPVKAKESDVIYNVTKDNGKLRFFRIQVMPSTQCNNSEYCEELI